MAKVQSDDNMRYAMRVLDEVNTTSVPEQDMWELMNLLTEYHREHRAEHEDNFVPCP